MSKFPQIERVLRIAFRLIWLAAEGVLGFATFAALLVVHGGRPNRVVRARWLQRTCRRALRIFRLEFEVTGSVPSHGLLVCNHLSYLDILVLASLTPCMFVAKKEVKGWPLFGWFARLAGTIFVQRERRCDVTRTNQQIRDAIDSGALAVLFPEGTTSDGRDVLPFKSSLLEPAASHEGPITAGFIQYSLSDGDVAEEVCYWKDMTLLPHLLNLFGKNNIAAAINLSAIHRPSRDRKQLAHQLRSEVIGLKGAFSNSSVFPVRFAPCSRPIDRRWETVS